MPIVYKATMIFRFTPDAALFNIAAPGKVGGFSESYWFPQAVTKIGFQNWANKRANLMGADVQITGWRQTPYTYTNNKLIPGRSSVGVLSKFGLNKWRTNSADDALRILATANSVPVSFNVFLHAPPDDVIDSGQYIGGNDFGENFDAFTAAFLAGGNAPIWVGRDPTQIAQQVVAVDGAAHTITTQASIAAVAMANYVRLRRVYDDNGIPITGSYLCTLVTPNVADGSVTYRLAGLPARTRITPSGTARIDRIAQAPITTLDVRSLGERKAGRPSGLYRGRRTRTRV